MNAAFRHESQFTCPSEYWRQQATVPSAVFPCRSLSSSSTEGECARLAEASSVHGIDVLDERVKIIVSM
jgi:hypothetical protein